MAKRKFNQDFIKYGFTSSSESLRPSKLQKNLEKNHPGLKGKDIEYFKRLENGLKRQ